MNRLPCVVGTAVSEAASMTVRPWAPPLLLVTTILLPPAAGVRPNGKRSTSMLVPAGRMHHPVGVVPAVFGSLRQSAAAAEAAAGAAPAAAPTGALGLASPVSCRNRSEPATGARSSGRAAGRLRAAGANAAPPARA